MYLEDVLKLKIREAVELTYSLIYPIFLLRWTILKYPLFYSAPCLPCIKLPEQKISRKITSCQEKYEVNKKVIKN